MNKLNTQCIAEYSQVKAGLAVLKQEYGEGAFQSERHRMSYTLSSS